MQVKWKIITSKKANDKKCLKCPNNFFALLCFFRLTGFKIKKNAEDEKSEDAPQCFLVRKNSVVSSISRNALQNHHIWTLRTTTCISTPKPQTSQCGRGDVCSSFWPLQHEQVLLRFSHSERAKDILERTLNREQDHCGIWKHSCHKTINPQFNH